MEWIIDLLKVFWFIIKTVIQVFITYIKINF